MENRQVQLLVLQIAVIVLFFATFLNSYLIFQSRGMELKNAELIVAQVNQTGEMLKIMEAHGNAMMKINEEFQFLLNK